MRTNGHCKLNGFDLNQCIGRRGDLEINIMLLRFCLFLLCAMLSGGTAKAQHGPGHTACEFKWVEAGKPADYKGFMEKCDTAQQARLAQHMPSGPPTTSMTLSGQQPAPTTPQQPVIDPQLQAAAYKLFPWASQTKQRTQWLAAQVAAQMHKKNPLFPPTAAPQSSQPVSTSAACKRFPNLC
jgi:hypothetical protein